MAGFLAELQRGLGRALKEIHKAGGFQVRYRAVINRTVDPVTTENLDIFIQPTPNVRVREKVGGRVQDVFASGAQLSAEALPVFAASRQALLLADGVTFHVPTTQDTFQELDSSGSPTGDIFEVIQVTAIGGRAAGYFLSVVNQSSDQAQG